MALETQENSKCYVCKNNFKSTNYSEPKCNCMCENYSDFEPITNYDRILRMTVEEMADFLKSMVDDDGTHNVACYGCINYGTHHADPANKANGLYECEGCDSEGIGLDLVKWLKTAAHI